MSFKNKKVTVMGLGLHGGGVAVVKWLVAHGANVTVTDLKSKTQLKPAIDQLRKVKVRLVLGRHLASDFKNVDYIVKNPGVPSSSKYLALAKKNKILIENDASLFFKHCAGKIIGVTGTRGKSTTATLIHKFLPTSYLGGLSGQPMMDILERVKADNWAVLELSSWQLEILGQQKLSPDIAVVTNIYPDHLNRYSSMDSYIAAKKNIYLNQNRGAVVVLNKDNPETKAMGREVRSKRLWFSKQYFSEQNGSFVKGKSIFLRQHGQEIKLVDRTDIKLSGQHNLENVLAALAAVSGLELNLNLIKKVLKGFSGLAGRMELLGRFSGISYVNDTTSTMPEATSAGLGQFSGKRVVLIAGGDSKSLPDESYQALGRIINQKCKAVVLFDGRGSQQIIKYLKTKPRATGLKNMTEAVALAKSFAETGDTILLSPACASFNLFANEFDRGDQFIQAVASLRGNQKSEIRDKIFH